MTTAAQQDANSDCHGREVFLMFIKFNLDKLVVDLGRSTHVFERSGESFLELILIERRADHLNSVARLHQKFICRVGRL